MEFKHGKGMVRLRCWLGAPWCPVVKCCSIVHVHQRARKGAMGGAARYDSGLAVQLRAGAILVHGFLPFTRNCSCAEAAPITGACALLS